MNGSRTGPGPAAVFRVGLTGGIATGKSTVAEVFRSEGAFVLDADRVGHELVEPGQPAYDEIRRAFGDSVLGPDLRIDREQLGNRIFGDPEARRILNAILHPRILAEIERRIEEFAERSPGGIAVAQAALLVEAGATGFFDRIVATDCDAALQVRRLSERDRIGSEEALRRIRTQADSPRRRSAADLVIDTSGTLEQTVERAREVFSALRREWEHRTTPRGGEP